ncbi:MAG: N-methyl-L-tryptophan oxidase [Pirellulales bacterium]|nr:N-methyl-L-tryptophan oxidase [Pirellulales bacterium]
MAQVFDTIVIGGGGMGSAAAAELAARGERVLVCEQFPLGHHLGSSHGHTRIIRQAYYEHPDYVPLLLRAYERWAELADHGGQQLLFPCGLLSIGHPTGELIQGIQRSAAEHQLRVDPYTAGQIQQRWPQFTIPQEHVGLFEPAAGYLLVEECVRAYLRLASARGAALLENEAVISWRAGQTDVSVRTIHGEYHAARLIITAGAWAGHLLAGLGLPLTVMRQLSHWFSPPPGGMWTADHFPCYMVETPAGAFYGFPHVDQRGLKVARHYGARELPGPEYVDRAIDPVEASPAQAFFARYLPHLAAQPYESAVCLYTLTPDRHFVIDRHPQWPQVVLAAGFSGHGFKFASVVGEILADLALTGKTALPIGMFAMNRFAGER